MKALLNVIKRNPVINGFILMILAQFLHDYMANEIDWTNISGYVASLFIAVAVRERTVPLAKHEKLAGSVSESMVALEANYRQKLREIDEGR